MKSVKVWTLCEQGGAGVEAEATLLGSGHGFAPMYWARGDRGKERGWVKRA